MWTHLVTLAVSMLDKTEKNDTTVTDSKWNVSSAVFKVLKFWHAAQRSDLKLWSLTSQTLSADCWEGCIIDVTDSHELHSPTSSRMWWSERKWTPGDFQKTEFDKKMKIKTAKETVWMEVIWTFLLVGCVSHQNSDRNRWGETKSGDLCSRVLSLLCDGPWKWTFSLQSLQEVQRLCSEWNHQSQQLLERMHILTKHLQYFRHIVEKHCMTALEWTLMLILRVFLQIWCFVSEGKNWAFVDRWESHCVHICNQTHIKSIFNHIHLGLQIGIKKINYCDVLLHWEENYKMEIPLRMPVLRWKSVWDFSSSCLNVLLLSWLHLLCFCREAWSCRSSVARWLLFTHDLVRGTRSPK